MVAGNSDLQHSPSRSTEMLNKSNFMNQSKRRANDCRMWQLEPFPELLGERKMPQTFGQSPQGSSGIQLKGPGCRHRRQSHCDRCKGCLLSVWDAHQKEWVRTALCEFAGFRPVQGTGLSVQRPMHCQACTGGKLPIYKLGIIILSPKVIVDSKQPIT